jgi:CheY-like chemotaxis protein
MLVNILPADQAVAQQLQRKGSGFDAGRRDQRPLASLLGYPSDPTRLNLRTPLADTELCTHQFRREGRAMRVLIIEDNWDAADSLRKLLRLLGHEVRVAYTGPGGVREAAEWRPDVVLCDIGLPGLDGYEVALELRRLSVAPSTRLIALTAHGTDEDRRRSREVGFEHHLVKPAEPSQLLRLLVSG